MFLLSLDALEVRRLASPQGSVGDYNPAFSPDGRTLAFNRGSQGVTSIYTVPVSAGEEKRLVSGIQCAWALPSTPAGRQIVLPTHKYLADAPRLHQIPPRA